MKVVVLSNCFGVVPDALKMDIDSGDPDIEQRYCDDLIDRLEYCRSEGVKPTEWYQRNNHTVTAGYEDDSFRGWSSELGQVLDFKIVDVNVFRCWMIDTYDDGNEYIRYIDLKDKMLNYYA